jgi:hypothetical protein
MVIPPTPKISSISFLTHELRHPSTNFDVSCRKGVEGAKYTGFDFSKREFAYAELALRKSYVGFFNYIGPFAPERSPVEQKVGDPFPVYFDEKATDLQLNLNGEESSRLTAKLTLQTASI